MRVALFQNLIDPQWTSLSMERYGHELKKNLDRLQNEEVSVVSFQPQIPKVITYLPTRWRYQISRYFYYPYFAQRHEGQINHIIDHSFGQVARFLNKKRTVITCHDLIPLKYLPDGTRVEKDLLALELFQKSVSYLKEVGLVLADSEATKRDLISTLQVPEHNIEVIPLGRNEAFRRVTGYREIVEKLNLPSKPLLLHVGHNLPYKNIPGILRTLKILKERNIDFHFIKVGPPFTGDDAKLVAQLDLTNSISQIGFLGEKELIMLYNAAATLIYPSLFEGFGLPALEAMSCGLVPLVSKETSLEEIVQEKELLVDPKNPEEIATGVEKILNLETDELKLLQQKLMATAEKFTWEKTAQLTMAAYIKLYEN